MVRGLIDPDGALLGEGVVVKETDPMVVHVPGELGSIPLAVSPRRGG